MAEKSRPIPIPAGGFRSHEDEARWLADTIALRSAEAVAVLGLAVTFPTQSLYDLLLVGLRSAAKRASEPRCGICGRALNQPDDPSTLDCGGDCRRCMAEAGDPDCAAAGRATTAAIELLTLIDVAPGGPHLELAERCFREYGEHVVAAERAKLAAIELPRRADGSAHITVPSLPGFHFIISRDEDMPRCFLDTLDQFVKLYVAAIRDEMRAPAAERAKLAASDPNNFHDSCCASLDTFYRDANGGTWDACDCDVPKWIAEARREGNDAA